MGRMIGVRPMTGYERLKRYRERKKLGSPSEWPEPSDAEKLKEARREIRQLTREIEHLRSGVYAEEAYKIWLSDTSACRRRLRSLQSG
jgi:hypothetical protein